MAERIKGRTGEWEIVIGMEVHAQIITESKLFSGASSRFGAEPNAQVSIVDAAMPGMLPVLNKYCVEQAVRTGLGLNAQINLHSVFERKNYFYPDLPQGYQISQYLHPIVGKGQIEIDLPDGSVRTIGITRLHLEQDAGKSLHDQHPRKSYVDLNRSGCALMEIVSEPDLRGAEESAAYLAKLRMILQYLGTCNGNMEEGSMRADVNVSVRKAGAPLGTRCEIKNVNSIKAVQLAIAYESRRQVHLLEEGGEIRQETRLWDPVKAETRSMRSKEEAHDYRYFPDPDLLPLVLEQTWVESLAADLPELPDAKKHRFMKDYGLSAYDSSVLVAERARANYFETAARECGDPKLAANWLLNELLALLNRDAKDIAQSPVSAQNLAGLIALIADGTISGKIAKDVFPLMYDTGKTAAILVEEKGLRQVTDQGAIDSLVDSVLTENSKIVEDYKSGNPKVFGFLVGQIMKKSQGKANPAAVNAALKERLGSTNE